MAKATSDFLGVSFDTVQSFGLNFVRDLALGDTIETVASYDLTVAPTSRADDDDPAARINGSAGISTTIVAASIGPFPTLDVLYVLHAVIATHDGETLDLWCYLGPITGPPGIDPPDA